MAETLTKQEQDKLLDQIKAARIASKRMAILGEIDKNQALGLIERELLESVEEIVSANKLDLEEARKNNTSAANIDRLTLNAQRIQGMAKGIRNIINIKEEIGRVEEGWTHPKGMRISKVRVPLGVIGIIYEARPNVTTDAIALAIKSGNGLVLRGSCHAWNSNLAIMAVVERALKQTNVPYEGIQFLQCKARESAKLMLSAKEYIDLVIPRGGEELNHFVTANSLIPVLGAGGGTCHTYIDETADLAKAIEIAYNAKVQRPSVCNSCETILVHKNIAKQTLTKLAARLREANVELIGDEQVQALVAGVQAATEEDWAKEYLDLKVAIKVVDSLEDAVDHINHYSTAHSDSIITENMANAEYFKRNIDSACVYVNVSTRFTDGEEFGFGAEMGISTQKMHARGPIGLRELCTYKYIIEGEGQTR